MNPPPLRIATRKSALALWQAEHVAAQLRALAPDRAVELLPLTTQGDRNLADSLAEIGGKGLFIKELEVALAEGRADFAVHSMKDVPAALPPGFCIAAVLEREDARDAFVATHFAGFEALPQGARLGSSSLRRQCQLRHRRPDLVVTALRGNVDTRLGKLAAGEYDAIVLAVAGLKRLGLAQHIAAALDFSLSLPAVTQGIIGIECRADDAASRELAARLNHAGTWQRAEAERALNLALGGSCVLPLAAYAELEGDSLWLRARVGLPDGSRLIEAERRAPAHQAETLGRTLAEDMLARGAGEVLRHVAGA
ncbi:MAG TPA: hydroxymethylbilane synthase [Gammaproteobacteria bacterium]|nr:hydroxymethylbilane synthase [Gammaproteobacteria bacterium]